MAQSYKSPWHTTRCFFLILAMLLVAGCSSKEQLAENHYERAMKFVAQHDDIKASIEFRNALQLDKNMLKAWRGLAGIEERNKNWGSLIGIRRTIVELAPKDVDAKLQSRQALVPCQGPGQLS